METSLIHPASTSRINRFVRFREYLTDTLLGIPKDKVLNFHEDGLEITTVSESNPGQQIKKALNSIKAKGMTPSGNAVYYKWLPDSKEYQVYRKAAADLRKFDPLSLDTTSKQKAFWINIYNAMIIDAVLYYDIQTSVTEGPLGLLRFFRKSAYNIHGYRVSAEDIEHGILRANQGSIILPGPHFASDDPRAAWVLDELDPRIHFALNCTSKSCPPIGVYEPVNIDAQLDLAAENFILQDVFIDKRHHKIKISRIFKWFSRDFGSKSSMLDFVSTYLPDKQSEWIQANKNNLLITYAKYDWSLNSV